MPSRRHRSKLFRQRLKIVLIVIAILAFLAGAYWMAQSLGPSGNQTQQQPVALDSAQIEEMQQKVYDLRQEYALRERAGGEMTAEDLALLTEAIEIQLRINQALNLIGKPEDREVVERMREKRDATAAQPLHEESQQLEREGRSALNAKEFGEAYEKLQEAAILQEKINREYPDSGFFDASRLVRLRSQYQRLGLQPLHASSMEAQQEGEKAIAAEDFKTALAQYEKALELQEEIIEQDRGSAYADLSRVRRLEQQILDLKASSAAQTSDELKVQANEAIEAGDFEKAVKFAKDALNRQQTISRTYPGSRYSSSERTAEFRRLVDTASSGALAAEVTEVTEKMNAALRERRTGAAMELATQALRAYQQMRSEYPQSRFLDEEANLHLRFITLLGSDLASLQENFYANLNPIPGMEDKRMYTREIPQFLYQRLSGTNTSSNKGDSLPVESITWHEAQDFSRKLSWMMGYPVRLPTEAEYKAALGDPQVTVDSAWTSQNSDREIQPVNGLTPNANGFYHLLGNVSEWLQDDAPKNASEALVIGGSSRDNPIRLAEVPQQARAKTERNRYTGFRVVVLTGEE